MADKPTWLTGRNVSSLTITGATASTSDGSITDATGTGAQTILTKFESLSFNSEPVTEEISAASSTRSHTVILQDANSATVRCIMQTARRTGESTNNAANPLALMFANYDILKLAWGKSGETWTLYGTRGPFSEEIVKGKSVQTITLLPLDSGAANPAIT